MTNSIFCGTQLGICTTVRPTFDIRICWWCSTFPPVFLGNVVRGFTEQMTRDGSLMCDGNLFCGTDCRRTIDGSRRGGKGRSQWRIFGCDQGQECERREDPVVLGGVFFVLVAISEETWNPMSLSWDHTNKVVDWNPNNRSLSVQRDIRVCKIACEQIVAIDLLSSACPPGVFRASREHF